MGNFKEMSKSFDPRGLIYESYQIDGITREECRSIFFDWALGANDGAGSVPHIQELLSIYGDDFPAHPMTDTLKEGLEGAEKPRRRGGWRSRDRKS